MPEDEEEEKKKANEIEMSKTDRHKKKWDCARRVCDKWCIAGSRIGTDMQRIELTDKGRPAVQVRCSVREIVEHARSSLCIGCISAAHGSYPVRGTVFSAHKSAHRSYPVRGTCAMHQTVRPCARM